MFAVIPHPTEALLLSRMQKASLLRLNAEAGKVLWMPAFPLWAVFNNFDYRAAESGTAQKKQTQCGANEDKMQAAPCAGSLQTELRDAARRIGGNTQSAPLESSRHIPPRGTIMQTDGNADTAFGEAQLKTLRDAITSFTIGAPETTNGELFFPATLCFRNGSAAFGKITAGTILTDTTHGGKTADNTASGTANIPPERRSTYGGADFSSSDRCADNDKNSTDANGDTSPLRAAEDEGNLFGRFPYACRVFRIADAEIVCTLPADGNNARENTGDISACGKAASGEETHDGKRCCGERADGMQLNTWRVHKSIWVKTESKTRR